MGFFSTVTKQVRDFFGCSSTNDQGKKSDKKLISPPNPAVQVIRRLRPFFCRARNAIASTRRRVINWVHENPWNAAAIAFGIIILVLLAATPAILGAVGFSAIGPVAGSMAAAYQSAFGATAAFAFFQGAAMEGYAMGVIATFLGISGGTLVVLGFGGRIAGWITSWFA